MIRSELLQALARENPELRSEDVQEILGTPPHWLVRWGTTVVLAGFVMILCAAWFIRYQMWWKRK